jgi:DNA-binding response OmpR family regulator
VKVLVVDGDAGCRVLITYTLRCEGYQVIAAVDGQQALQRWETENPDVMLLDATLSGIDGFELCQRVRRHSSMPIIMLTARDETQDILRGLRSGADGYLTKPFSPRQLAADMKTVLSRRQIAP